jgi:putative peptidoglycan lipid II flippase
MSNALVFWQLPFGIFSASITTVLFPRMSRQAGLGDAEGLTATLEYGLRYLILFLVPAACIMSFLAKQIIAVALQRGNFLPLHTVLTAKVLIAYNLGLFSVGAFNFFQRFFYACDNYKTPLVSDFVVCALDIVLSLILKETSLRVAGLALANTISFSLGLLIMWFSANSGLKGTQGAVRTDARRQGLNPRPLLLTLLKSLAAVCPAGLFMWLFIRYTGPWWMQGSTAGALAYLSIAGGGACCIILIMYRIMKIDIVMNILRREVK